MTIFELPFTEADIVAAYDGWHCNCGPASLAAVLGCDLPTVRGYVSRAGFSASRWFMSPTMMQNAVRHAGRIIGEHVPAETFFPESASLARIQFGGPWMNKGVNPKWKYWHTHWIASFERGAVVFDINGGLMDRNRWQAEIVPLLTANIDRADGTFHVTHCWEVLP